MLGSVAGLKTSLTKTRQSFFGRIGGLFHGDQVTGETWEELEALLIQADVGARTTLDLIENLQREAGGLSAARVEALLKERLIEILEEVKRPYLPGERMLNVVLIVGVNGSGKTTCIAKLAKYHQDRGEKVILAAADTFRAAAIDQLEIWGERLGVEVVAHQPNADPGAVVFDAIRASQSRRADVLFIDTAGRLHSKYNLMQELQKISSVARKQVHQAPHETMLVLDATTGQNALSQAKVFQEVTGVNSAILSKLDSTSKGGMAFAVASELRLPILFVTTGESPSDLAEFDARAFVEGLFAEN
ncbi:MAG: signal recognition particle-docking protein FtsY [Anaerolineales bacterium]